jgi:hypothetical protein
MIALGKKKILLKRVAGMKDLSKMTKRNAWDTYHIVSRADVMSGRASAVQCLAEIMMRLQYADKHYGGRIDNRHLMWMVKLWNRVDLVSKVSLPIDNYSFIVSKMQPVRHLMHG